MDLLLLLRTQNAGSIMTKFSMEFTEILDQHVGYFITAGKSSEASI